MKREKKLMKHLKNMITELKTLLDLRANLLKLGRAPSPRKQHGTRRLKTVTMDKENDSVTNECISVKVRRQRKTRNMQMKGGHDGKTHE